LTREIIPAIVSFSGSGVTLRRFPARTRFHRQEDAMCEGCDSRRETAWAEIRDLLNYNRKVRGPLSEMVAEKLQETVAHDSDFAEMSAHEMSVIVDAIRASMIQERCVIIAQSSPATHFHGIPAHIIAYEWAGQILRKEMEQAAEANPLLALLALFAQEAQQEEENNDE
jgi:hypothetical protein